MGSISIPSTYLAVKSKNLTSAKIRTWGCWVGNKNASAVLCSPKLLAKFIQINLSEQPFGQLEFRSNRYRTEKNRLPLDLTLVSVSYAADPGVVTLRLTTERQQAYFLKIMSSKEQVKASRCYTWYLDRCLNVSAYL